MSLQWIDTNECGTPGTPSTLQKVQEKNAIFARAIRYAELQGKDVLWVFAAGNECRDAKFASPASLAKDFPQNTITVAAVEETGDLWFDFDPISGNSFGSNFGSLVTVAAPGRNILSTIPGDRYDFKTGTSMAAPHVSGLAALVLSEHPTFTAAQVKQCIVSAAQLQGAVVPGRNFRVINAPEAVKCQAGGFSQLSFTRTDFATGGLPVSVIAGDFSGDGKLDLVTANFTVSTVSVLLGNGDGTFRSKTDFPTSFAPLSVTSGDFNSDGKLDLAVATGAGTVSILLGNGNGTFGSKTDFATSDDDTRGVITADFNRDGKADLATVNDNRTVSILLGNGDGTFSPKREFAAGSFSASLIAADFNGDGKLDLATTDFLSFKVSVLLGNGDGTLGPKTDFPSGGPPSSLATADFNGDARPDLAVATGNPTISILLSNGDGTFGAPSSFGIGGGTAGADHGLTTGDFNADGKLDFSVGNSRLGTNTVSVFLNTSQ